MNNEIKTYFYKRGYNERVFFVYEYFFDALLCDCLDDLWDYYSPEELDACISKALRYLEEGYSKEWVQRFSMVYEDENVTLSRLVDMYETSTNPEKDLDIFCKDFDYAELFRQRIMYYINKDYVEYTKLDYDSDEWLSHCLYDVEVWSQLINDERSEEYIWYYLHHMNIDYGDEEMVALRSHIYDVAIKKDLTKEKAEALANEDMEFATSVKEFIRKYPEQWQRELVATIYGNQLVYDWPVLNEDEFVQIFARRLLNSTESTMIEDLAGPIYREYYVRYPNESGTDFWLEEQQYEEEDNDYDIKKDMLSMMFSDSEDLNDDIEDFIHSYDD